MSVSRRTLLQASLAASALLLAPLAVAADGKIIVTGASGQLGELVVEELLARGVSATELILVTRNTDELKAYASRGAQVRFGDFTKPESLPAAFAGGSRMVLISISGGAMPRPEAHGNAIDAAVKAGVKHIAYTSWVGLSSGDASGIGADHQKTEELLRKSGASWTMLRNSLYGEVAVQQAAQMARTGKAIAVPDATGVSYVARRDCAAAAAAVVSTPGHEGKAYDITGPSAVSPAQLAAIVSELTGREVKVMAPDASTPAGRGFGGPALTRVSTHVADLTGRSATTMRQLLEANRDKLKTE